MSDEQTINDLRKEVKMLETLIELNMKDCHEIADQRNKYYEELQTWKDMYNSLLDIKDALEKRISDLETLK